MIKYPANPAQIARLVEITRQEVPSGWRVETSSMGRHVVIEAPHGFVTLDPRWRGFRLGAVTTGPLFSHPGVPFTGRNWQRNLTQAAIRALQRPRT